MLGFGGEGASKLFDGLIRHDATLKVVPTLAAEVPAVGADGRSWTVQLRQGVTFHDGSAFDAEDVVATYRAVLDPVFASTVRSDFPMLLADPPDVRSRTQRRGRTWKSARSSVRLTISTVDDRTLRAQITRRPA